MTYDLAIKLLDQAEELIGVDTSQESLLDTLEKAEKLLPEDAPLLCRSARVLFRFGIFNGKGRFFLLALDKLKRAEEKDPLFLDSTPIWWQLWGNILIQLGKLLDDTSFFEMAIQKYQKASKVAKELDPEVYWDLGDAWTLMGHKSGEPGDLSKALSQFREAQNLGIDSPFFLLDYANALTLYGQLTGNPHTVEEAISCFHHVILKTYRSQEEPAVSYLVGWRKFALAHKMRYQLAHHKEHFEECDAAFREAILASPKNGDLWLDWGELYLHAGWLKRDIKLIEVALEKLTSTKIKECDPIRASLLLGLSLVSFGLFLENLKLMKDGQERIRIAFDAAPQSGDLLFALAFADMAIGLYYSDDAFFAKAAPIFEKGIQANNGSVHNWHALFQTYFAWGVNQDETSLIQKGIKAITRLCELCPFSPIYLNEWGIALLRLRQMEGSKEQAQAYIEEAIDKFRKACELCEEDEILFNWGCALDLLGDLTAEEEDYARAIDLLTKVFEKKPSEVQVRYHLGLAFSHLGELTQNADCLSQAVELLDSATKINPEDENFWSDLGYAGLNLSQLIFDSIYPAEGEKIRLEAEKALLRAVELGSADACYHLACLYSLSGFYDASLHYLLKAAMNGHLPPREDLENDEWLDGVRETEDFQDFLTAYGEKNEDENG